MDVESAESGTGVAQDTYLNPHTQGLEGVIAMRTTKRRPVTVGQILMTEFLEPMRVDISELADAMEVHRNTLSRIVNDKGSLTAPIAIKLAAALGNMPEFWLSIQHAVETWDVRHRAYDQEAKNVRRIKAHLDSHEVTPGRSLRHGRLSKK